MKHTFSQELYIAYSICQNCNNNEFIVSGQTQICNDCRKHLFRTLERKYNSEKFKIETIEQNFIDKNKIIFPKTITIAYAYCNSIDCNYGEEVVDKEKVICQHCMNEMELRDKLTYILNYETFQCPICAYNGLYLPTFKENGIGSYETCPNCKFQFTYYDEREIKKYKEKWKRLKQ